VITNCLIIKIKLQFSCSNLTAAGCDYYAIHVDSIILDFLPLVVTI